MRADRCAVAFWLIFTFFLAPVGSVFGQNNIRGSVQIDGDLTIHGDLRVTGNLTVDGRIITSDNPLTAQTPEAFLVQLWNLDQQHNGLSVTLRDSNGAWKDETAAIRLDEQNEHVHQSANVDLAPQPLIVVNDASKLSGSTYQTVKMIFDNYHANESVAEDELGSNATEDQEIDNFLNAVLDTQVMETCLTYINEQNLAPDGQDLTTTTFKKLLKFQWFELYTNHFSTPKAHISGFEHVFVGDRGGNGIGGHHFWWKFFLDQEAGSADSLGHNYKGPAGEQYRWLATFRMTWQPEGNPRLTQPDQKGFFVGPSPELMLAYGTLGLLLEKKNNGAHPTIDFDGGRYELVIHASTLPGPGDADSRRGDQIRSAFPKLLSVGSNGNLDPSDAITVADALATSIGQQVQVTGVITDAHNEEFGLRLADTVNSPQFLAIKLPQSFRADFNPKLNPDAKGLKVTIEGRRDKYTGIAGIISVNQIQLVQ